MNSGLQTFLDSDSELPKLIIVYGPTASGKTSLSIDIAKQLDTEIISADSRQIYRHMDIGTAKVTEEEMDGVAHHMIDIRDPDTVYSVGEYVRESQIHIDRLLGQNKIPILCGGTGLYIDAIRYQFDIPEVVADIGMRKELDTVRLEQGNVALWEILHNIDPIYADQLHPNNYQYVMRGIEVFRTTGKSKLELRTRKIPKYNVHMVAPDMDDRSILYDRITTRVDMMIEEGLEGEVRDVLSRFGFIGNEPESQIFEKIPGFRTIGYSEFLSFFRGEISLERVVEMIAQNSRKYAKRQMTWFRS